MRGLILMRGLPISQVTCSNGNGAEFLAAPDPKEVWQAATTATSNVYIDLGTASEFDTIFVGFTNAVPESTWSAARVDSMAGAGAVSIMSTRPFAVPDYGNSRSHGFEQLPAPVTSRYLRLSLAQPTGAEPLRAGVVMVGKRFESPYEWKSGRRPIDLTERVDLAGGGFGFGPGAIKSSFRATVADLDDADLRLLWQLVKQTGNQKPIVLLEGGDGAIEHDQLHYGVFERFEAYERENPADTRWSLSMLDWV